MNQNFWLKTAVSLIILLLITACTVTEARPTIIPTVVTPTPQATAVPPTPEPTTATVIALATPTTPLAAPTAVPTRYIEPTPTPTPNYPMLPSENSLSFALQNQFGGMPRALLVDDSVAYLAVGPRLVAVDVTDPAAPQFLGQSPVVGDALFDIVQVGARVYGAAGRAGLVMFDVSDPTSIQLASGGPNYSGAKAPNATQIVSSNGRVFISNVDYTVVEGDLIWFDLAANGQPTFASSMPLDEANARFSATADLLFIPSKAGIQVVDPQNPTQPLSVIEAGQEVYQVFTAVHHNLPYLIYMDQQGTHFTIYDLADPTSPQIVPQNQPVSLNFLSELTSNDNILATSFTFGEFGYCSSQITIVDTTQPEAPQKTTEFDPQNCISEIAGSGELLYVAGISGLQIFSTSDPANLQLLGTYTNPFGLQTVDDILPGQPTSYVLTSEGRGSIIASLDMAQPTPTLLSQTEPFTGNQILQLLGTGQTIIAPVWNNSMLIFDTTNPANLSQLYAPQEEGEVLSQLHSTALVGSVLYMPMASQYVFSGNLGTFDLQDPSNPQLISSVNTGLQTLETIVVGDGYLYLLEGYEQLKLAIIDISQPLEPKLVSNITLPEDASRLAVVGSTLYAMCAGDRCQSLTVIDVADAERPSILNQWQLPFGVVDSVTIGQRLYTISSDNTVRALDVSQPEQPKVIGAIALPGSYGRLTADENTLYVSAGANGLYMLTTSP
ncbi:MAG: hypothetical protein CL608_05710 [Anaerolineaceae bacterium]|nr:hypothetical protein [Anaerolineaceae bacterium]